jgi:hypothetical protein
MINGYPLPIEISEEPIFGVSRMRFAELTLKIDVLL